jgi:hypothetical protein
LIILLSPALFYSIVGVRSQESGIRNQEVTIGHYNLKQLRQKFDPQWVRMNAAQRFKRINLKNHGLLPVVEHRKFFSLFMNISRKSRA